jgi:hypothetical protein
LKSTYASRRSDDRLVDLCDLARIRIAVVHRLIKSLPLRLLVLVPCCFLLLRAKWLLHLRLGLPVGNYNIVCVVDLVVDLSSVQHCGAVVDRDVG